MVLFLWLKIAINFQKWVHRGMVDTFFAWNFFLGVSLVAALYTTPISSSYQVLLSPYYTVDAQTTPYKCSFQLFLSVTPSYSCELLLSSVINR